MAEELTELQIIDQAIARIDAEVAARNEAAVGRALSLL